MKNKQSARKRMEKTLTTQMNYQILQICSKQKETYKNLNYLANQSINKNKNIRKTLFPEI